MFVVFLDVGPRVHVNIVSCEERNQVAHLMAKLPRVGGQISGLTVPYRLLSGAGTSVGDDDDDEGQDHICPDDAGYRPRLNPVARAVWGGGGWGGGSDRWKISGFSLLFLLL